MPYPPDKGDRIRNWHVLRYLARHGQVYLASLADEPVPEQTLKVLRETAERVTWNPVEGFSRKLRALNSALAGRSLSEGMFRSPSLLETLRQWVGTTRFDVVVCSASSVAHYLQLEGLEKAIKCVDLVDVDSRKWQDYADSAVVPKKWLYRREARTVSRLEREICQWAQSVTLVSEAEAELLRSQVGSCRAAICSATNGVDLEYYSPGETVEPKQPTLIFTGAFDYKPNIDGALWFCRDIWPGVRQKFPQAILQLVGRNPSPEVKALGSMPGVEILGTVPDIRPYLSAASIAVAPLRIARGLQNKVLEALAMRKAVVASPSALNGFGISTELPALTASTPEQWHSAIAQLLYDRELREELGQRGRQFAERNHDWNRCLEPLGKFFPVSTVNKLIQETAIVESGS